MIPFKSFNVIFQNRFGVEAGTSGTSSLPANQIDVADRNDCQSSFLAHVFLCWKFPRYERDEEINATQLKSALKITSDPSIKLSDPHHLLGGALNKLSVTKYFE